MTTESAYSGDDPRRLLSGARELTQRVRRAQRATWFPLLVFAAVTFAAIPVNRFGGHHAGTCVAVPSVPAGGRICTIYSNAEFVYWPIALVLAYAAIAVFYIRRSRARGIETRVRQYAIAGIILAVGLTAAALWEAHHPSALGPDLLGLSGFARRLATPGTAIGLALLVLAWAERHRALLLLALAYLAAVLLPIGYVGFHSADSILGFLPLLIHGSVLLLGAIGFALAQRPWRPAA
jgi:hypothetical protein